MRQQYAKAPKGSDNSAPFVLAAVFGIVACVAAALFMATDSGVCLAIVFIAGICLLVTLAFGLISVEEGAPGGTASAHSSTNRQMTRYNAYIRELAIASRNFYAFLCELSRNERCRNMLKELKGMECFDVSNDFTIYQRLAIVVYCDIRDCFRKLGNDEGNLHGLSGIGYAMMLLQIVSKSADLNCFLDGNKRGRLLEIATRISEAQVELSVNGYEGEFRFKMIFGVANDEPDWVQRYSTHMYRWASLIAKADGMITNDESKALASILQMNETARGSNVRVSGSGADMQQHENQRAYSAKPEPTRARRQSLDSVIRELNSLIGLSSVKKDVKALANFITIQRKRKMAGLKEAPITYHCVFSGNPGTGKTTIARIMAMIFKELGVVKKGHLVETDRSGLVAEYVGQTAIKTNKIIDSAMDGVLFIDEAYTLAQGGVQDYGSEAIATLLKRMEDDRGRLVVILAGYTDEMQKFINSNPGLQSRFSRYINFPDYSADELAKIFLFTANKSQYVCNSDVKASLVQIMEQAIAGKDRNFGNGRFVRNLFEKAIQRQAVRLSTVAPLTTEMLSELTLHDLGFEYDN